jgi:hypothetical protein
VKSTRKKATQFSNKQTLTLNEIVLRMFHGAFFYDREIRPTEKKNRDIE